MNKSMDAGKNENSSPQFTYNQQPNTEKNTYT
jgi:hypothetical protein